MYNCITINKLAFLRYTGKKLAVQSLNDGDGQSDI